MNTTLKATSNTSKLEKIHPVYLSNKILKGWKICVNRQTVQNVNYTFSEEWRTSSATGMLFVWFIGIVPVDLLTGNSAVVMSIQPKIIL